MTLALREPMSLAEFLALGESQPLRYEFDGVGPVAMTGGSVRHAGVQANLAAALRARLRGSPCSFCGSDLKIRTADDRVRHPDGMIVCSPLSGEEKVIHDPVVVFKVLSSGTAQIDRFVKAREYQAMPSVRRYVMLEQDRVNATVYVRAGGGWTFEILIADSVLALPEVGVELPLAELYEGVPLKSEEEFQDQDRSG